MPFSAWQRLLQWKPGTPGGRLVRLCELAVRPVPGQSLAAFRIAFGLLMLNDVVFLLRGGWLTRFCIDRDILFPYFGLEVPSLPAPWLRGVCCVLVALGAPYRLAIRGFMGPVRIHADVGKSVNGRPRQRFQGKDHARFEIVALSEQLCDEARRRPAVDEPQGFSDTRLEPGFRPVKAAEGAFAVIEQEGATRSGMPVSLPSDATWIYSDPPAHAAFGRRLPPPDARLARRSPPPPGLPPGPRSGSASGERSPSLSDSKRGNRK